jgi:phospholipase D1/2
VVHGVEPMRPVLQPGTSAWRVLPVDRAAVIIDGEDYYRAFHQAAQRAERSLLLAGWQFDSHTCLLRGDEAAAAKAAEEPTELLEFLGWLCKRKPDLRVHLLAWNFHVVFALERQWMQEWIFNWKTHDRIRFHFDGHHPDSASHHQKFVVIDGRRTFLGGIDLCFHRWDRRKHCDPDELRADRGLQYNPFHDAQIHLEGREVGTALTELFAARWNASGGTPAIELKDHLPREDDDGWKPQGGVPLAARSVALSRTDPYGAPSLVEPVEVREVERLHLDAIAAAEESIYIETQYLSSRVVGEALVSRLRDVARPVAITLVTNPRAESPKEDIAVGLSQAKIMRDVRRAAEGSPHTLAAFQSLPECKEGEATRSTYIHSKLMIVDDAFVTVGSANLTNRSMGLDTELHASFEVGLGGDVDAAALRASIRHLRCELVREHAGLELEEDACDAAALLQMAGRGEGRLRPHPQPTEKELEILDEVNP